ncbi:hypothetical protein UFOVP820_38 [uncultured Caudovirales phage]|uniref:Uncharacterized protein n=1 Tax=uncultured Caudovirales phage TaxID=2100421 RepID=A0A6J5P0B3_9CAUD|nr:hypothetical protein UFOVP820_38 [uncultured Caudovirales phage]
MSRSVVWDIKEAFLWTDFGIEFAKRHFTEEQIAKLPVYKRGPKAGKIRGAIRWARVKEGGFVYRSPMQYSIPSRYVENRAGKMVAVELSTAEWGEEPKTIAGKFARIEWSSGTGNTADL